MGWITEIAFWHWWVLAGILVALELIKPTVLLLWLGFAAAAVGFLLLAFPSVPIHVQLVMYVLLSVISIIAWRRFRAAHRRSADRG